MWSQCISLKSISWNNATWFTLPYIRRGGKCWKRERGRRTAGSDHKLIHREMWKPINYDFQQQHGGTITRIEININDHQKWKDKEWDVYLGMKGNNINCFLLRYRTLLMDEGPLHKYLGTLEDTTSSYRSLPEIFSLTVDVGKHVQGTPKIIQRLSERWNQESYQSLYPLRNISSTGGRINSPYFH